MPDLLKEGERLDDLMIKNLGIIQDPKVFCFGIDAVLLSGFAKVNAGDKCLDLCSGNGIIPILLYAKTKAECLYGIEIQAPLAQMAQRSIKYNNLPDSVFVKEGDIRSITEYFEQGQYDVVTVNPPYIKGQGGLENDSESLNIARHETLCTLEDVAKAAYKVLKSKGRLYMVHRPGRLVEILKLLSDNHLEPKTLRLVAPFAGKRPNMVLIEAKKDAGSELIVEPTLVVYDRPGEYTEEVLKIYGKDK